MKHDVVRVVVELFCAQSGHGSVSVQTCQGFSGCATSRHPFARGSS